MPDEKHAIPELLAPAGGPDALRAAVANGADAVYLGVDRLNARQSAENFTLDNLADYVRLAHLAGTKVYLTLNVLVLDREMPEALELVDAAWACGIDAVIVQDLGLLRVVRESLGHVRVHASTQINTHNAPTVRTLVSRGVSRVTLARELSVDELTVLVRDTGAELESFVHGALCVCYSGQCLMSSLIGQRSANRGLCAQPCRLQYELIDADGRSTSSVGAHLLSPRDLAGITRLGALADAGVAALKIEGRMKSPEYVALVTGVYRSALDRLASDRDGFEVRDGELAVLSEAFNRGFSEAYLTGERGNDMMSYQRPNNRGVLIGRVVETTSGTATVNLDVALDAEDTVEFWTSSGRFAQKAGMLRAGSEELNSAGAGRRVTLVTERQASTGDRVFRVSNAALLAAARRTWSRESGSTSVPLSFTVRVVQGEPLSVAVEDERGRTGSATGAIVEPARTKAVSAEELKEHVGRLGGTPYEAAAWDIALSPAVGIGFSALHGVRRAAIEAYESGLLSPWRARAAHSPELTGLADSSLPHMTPRLEVHAHSLDVARAALEAGADAAHVPLSALEGEVPPGVVPVLPRIAHDAEVEPLLESVAGATRVVAGNLGLLAEVARRETRADAHWSLNALNGWTVAELADLGAGFVWLSPELSGRQVAAIAAVAAVPVGVQVYGRQEIMVTEHCVLMAEGECSRACATCVRRKGTRRLKDRKGYEFPVVTDESGRSHVYNSVPLDLTSAVPEIVEAGVSALLLSFSDESPEKAAEAVRHFRHALGSAVAGGESSSPFAVPATSGHFFRGVR